jgi:hypothetical protein
VTTIKLNVLEPGESRRTASETVRIIKRQVVLACRGVACKVTDLQTETGVKDKTAQYWIERALERSSQLVRQRTSNPETQDPRLRGKLKPQERKQIKKTIHSEISREVYRWVIEQPQDQYDKLAHNSRRRFSS